MKLYWVYRVNLSFCRWNNDPHEPATARHVKSDPQQRFSFVSSFRTGEKVSYVSKKINHSEEVLWTLILHINDARMLLTNEWKKFVKKKPVT